MEKVEFLFTAVTARGCVYCKLPRYRLSVLASLVVVLNLVLISASMPVSAKEYPHRDNRRVNDLAAVIDGATEKDLTDLLDDMRAESAVDATILTIDSIGSFDSGHATIESFATALFNQWGIGDAERNDGVLILVAVKDRDMRIEVGTGFGNEHDAALKKIIEQRMLPLFREQDYSGGIRTGTLATIDLLGGEFDYGDTAPGSRYNSANYQSADHDGGQNALLKWLAGLGGAGILGGGGLFAHKRHKRFKKRYCDICNDSLHRLDDREELEYLDDGEKVEQSHDSIDYDVWLCRTCEQAHILPYKNRFAKMDQCPSCGYRTTSDSHEVMQKATRSTKGQKRVTTTCRNCDFNTYSVVSIAMLADSSSSSSGGGSSSGGSSSGGGASGSW